MHQNQICTRPHQRGHMSDVLTLIVIGAMYLRVSDRHAQNWQSSFKTQRRRILTGIVQHFNLNTPLELSDVRPGTNADRPGYQELWKLVLNRAVLWIAVATACRLGRN